MNTLKKERKIESKEDLISKLEDVINVLKKSSENESIYFYFQIKMNKMNFSFNQMINLKVEDLAEQILINQMELKNIFDKEISPNFVPENKSKEGIIVH